MYTKQDYRSKHNFLLLLFLPSYFLFHTIFSLSRILLFGELGLSYFLAVGETSHSPSYRNPRAFPIRWENEIMLNDDGDSIIFEGPPVFVEASENSVGKICFWLTVNSCMRAHHLWSVRKNCVTIYTCQFSFFATISILEKMYFYYPE